MQHIAENSMFMTRGSALTQRAPRLRIMSFVLRKGYPPQNAINPERRRWASYGLHAPHPHAFLDPSDPSPPRFHCSVGAVTLTIVTCQEPSSVIGFGDHIQCVSAPTTKPKLRQDRLYWHNFTMPTRALDGTLRPLFERLYRGWPTTTRPIPCRSLRHKP